MANPSVQKLIQEATDALRRENPAKTLELAEEAISADESSVEGHQLRGIALTRLGNLEEASVAFRRATEVDPYDPKHFYNLAVNLRDRGLGEESEQMAREALRVDPKHVGAQALLGELAGEAPTGQGSGPWTERLGYPGQEHVLPFMYGTEKVWTGIGYVLLAVSSVLAVLMFVHLPVGLTGKPVAAGQLPDVGLLSDPLSAVVDGLWVFCAVTAFMWMFIDLIDRRLRFTWVVPIMIFSIVGLNAAPLAFYLFVGRRLALNGVPKP